VTIGARLRTLRRWRGLTQGQLAGLAALSQSFVSLVENGQRSLDRRSHIAAIAAALRVSETDLVGGPHLSADRQQSDPHAAISALREALQTNRLDAPAIDHGRPLDELARAVNEHITRLYRRADYAAAGALLPAVLDELHWHVAQAGDEGGRRLALETLVEACVAATELANVLRYTDLACVAALRGGEVAALLDDPVAHAGAGSCAEWRPGWA
jgi:transcriptional regulator with XRE-family HTH domain